MDVVEQIITLSEAFGRRLRPEAAELIAGVLPKNTTPAILREAARRMLKEYERFSPRDLLQVVDEILGEREVVSVKSEDAEADMRRVRQELDIPEPGEDEDEG
jgi:hypothetical protein